MELDDFKALYQARFEHLPDKSGQDLTALLQKRSYTAIERILHHLLWEIGMALGMALVLTLVLATNQSSSVRWLGLIVLLAYVIQAISFIGQYRQLKARLQLPVMSVREHVGGVLMMVKRFVRLYIRYTLISIPISMVLGGIIGATADDTDPAVSLFPEHPTLLMYGLVVVSFIAVIPGIYYGLKWYIYRLYGRYISELEHYVRELDELPD